jgi:hypothetical protein
VPKQTGVVFLHRQQTDAGNLGFACTLELSGDFGFAIGDIDRPNREIGVQEILLSREDASRLAIDLLRFMTMEQRERALAALAVMPPAT